jgi:hypothetical protein
VSPWFSGYNDVNNHSTEEAEAGGSQEVQYQTKPHSEALSQKTIHKPKKQKLIIRKIKSRFLWNPNQMFFLPNLY